MLFKMQHFLSLPEPVQVEEQPAEVGALAPG